MSLLALALSAAPAVAAPPPPPIINGEDATEDDYPMAGGMLMDAYLDLGRLGAFDVRLLVCSSTLIAPDVVLIAAHCLDDYAFTLGMGTISDKEIRWTRAADLSAWDGSAILDWPEDAVAARDWTQHPDFDILSVGLGLSLNYDIGLIFLDEPVLDVPLSYLPTPEEAATLAVDDEVAVVGWGMQVAINWWETPPEGSYGLKQMGWSQIADLADYELKIGEAESDVRKCNGDSGGPTFRYMEEGDDASMRQIGVTSHAWDESNCFKTGGVDTRVDYYLDWIEEQMSSRCEDGSRAWCEVPGILEPGYMPGEGDDGEIEDTGGMEDTGGIEDTGGATGTTDGGTTGTTDGGTTGTTDGGTTAGLDTGDGGVGGDDTAASSTEDPDAKGCSSTGGTGGPLKLLALLGLVALGRRRS